MSQERFISPDKKPPLGLRPRHISVSSRIQEIEEAMKRYMEVHMLIPQEWFEEYNELRDWLIEKGSL